MSGKRSSKRITTSSSTSSSSSASAVASKRTKVAEEEAALTTLQNVDIKKIMSSSSPEVSAVLLKVDGSCEEFSIDMSPRLKKTQAKLGGEITFLGQWEDLEVILLIRKDQTGKKMKLNKHKLQPPFHNAEVYGRCIYIYLLSSMFGHGSVRVQVTLC